MALKKSERYSSLWKSCDERRGGMDGLANGRCHSRQQPGWLENQHHEYQAGALSHSCGAGACFSCQTSDATHDAVQAMARTLGKSPITVKNAPGFVVNRILVPRINEAFFVLSEGLATAEDIDAGMKLGCNQPIGPLALADMVAAGHLGRKTGRGVYSY